MFKSGCLKFMNPSLRAREGFSECLKQLPRCSVPKVDGDHKLDGVYMKPQWLSALRQVVVTPVTP